MTDSTDDIIKALAEKLREPSPQVAPAMYAAASPPQAAPQSTASSGLDLLFRALIGVCAAGIGWLIITIPVLTNDVSSLKDDVSRIQVQTENTLTQNDVSSILLPLEQRIDRDTNRIDDNVSEIADMKGRIIRLEEQSPD